MRTVLDQGQQYIAEVGDNIEFLDSGIVYSVGRQIIQRAPGRIKNKKGSTEKPDGRSMQPSDAVELFMQIAAPFETYVPTSLVQRAQFQQLFCKDIASSLDIKENSVEFISCYPAMASAGKPVTEIVFLLLPSEGGDSTHRNEYLHPRVLAAGISHVFAPSASVCRVG